VNLSENTPYLLLANVVTFLEYCWHGPFYEVFEDDIQDLLLGIQKKHYDKNLSDYSEYETETVFARFLIAAISWNHKAHPNSFSFFRE
jgi:hypothetical protein